MQECEGRDIRLQKSCESFGRDVVKHSNDRILKHGGRLSNLADIDDVSMVCRGCCRKSCKGIEKLNVGMERHGLESVDFEGYQMQSNARCMATQVIHCGVTI